MTLPGFHDYTAGDTLTAAQMDGVHRQTIMYFATAAARNSALSGVLEEGLHAYTADTDTLWYYTGSAWKGRSSAWVTFTPSWTNVTVGSGNQAGWWCYQPGMAVIRARIILAADSAVGGAVTLTLPNSFQALNDSVPSLGVGVFFDDSSGARDVGAVAVSPNATTAVPYTNSGAQVNTSVPWTWATSDIIDLDFKVAL